MNVVIAPNAFKGCLSAAAAARAMARGVLAASPDATTVMVPMADGGDGLVDVLGAAVGARRESCMVTGPRGSAVRAFFALLPARDTAVVEMAQASGLALLGDGERDPSSSTTFGTGELILAALDTGVRNVYVGLGGSATHDAGCGMAAALGVRFLDDRGEVFVPVGGTLCRIHAVDCSHLDPRVRQTRFFGICDVDNPLTGVNGAARVYAPQKGASPSMVKVLEHGLEHWAAVMASVSGQDISTICDVSGAGAAGGMGAGLRVFLGAQLRGGAETVCDLVGLKEALPYADVVLTGEGALDGQTVFGKAPALVAACAKSRGLPCFALAGSVGADIAALHALGMTAVFSLCSGPMELSEAMRDSEMLLQRAAEQVMRTIGAPRLSSHRDVSKA